MVELQTRIDQTYAHFHRVLGGLLTELGALSGVIWLTEQQGHIVRGEGERNDYAWAIYRVSELGSYQERLAELETVQQQAVGELGLKRVPKELVTPRVVEGVTHVRLGSNEGHKSSVKKQPEVLAILKTALNTTKKNLREFERYGGEHDEGVRRLGAEITKIEKVRGTVVDAPEVLYRVRVEQRHFYPYVYRAGETPGQIKGRQHGLILVGQNIGVSTSHKVRKSRSDKRTLTPLFAFGKTQVYVESDWQEAKAQGKE